MPTRRIREARHGLIVFAAAVIVIPPTEARASSPEPGALDPTFGVGGEVMTDFGGNDLAYAVTVDTEGEVIAAGTTSNASLCQSIPLGCHRNIAVARYNHDGSADTSFGNAGIITSDIGTDVDVRAVATEPDGGIVVAGDARMTTGRHEIMVTRYRHDGTLDSGFGTSGVATTYVGIEDFGYGLAIQPDGDIVVAGQVNYEATGDFLVVRYHANGAIDSTFGSNGAAVVDFGTYSQAYSVAVSADGTIVAVGDVGNSHPSFGLARLTLNGDLDPAFGSDGQVTTSSGAQAYSVATLPDGGLVAGGWGYHLGGEAFTLARYRSDGSLDPTFGEGGVVVSGIGSGSAIYGLAAQPDDMIVAMGQTSSGVTAIARYEPDGSLDSSFGAGGITTTAYPGGGQAQAMALQSDGGIVTAGYSNSSVDFIIARYVGRTDLSAPVVTGSPDRVANSAGWYRAPVTITWSATDADDPPSALTLPEPTKAATEGRDVLYRSGPACDPAENCATGQLTLSIDYTSPVVTAIELTSNSILTTGSSTISVSATDALSGLVGGEIWVDSDPGIGNATPIALQGGTLSASLAHLPAGNHVVGVRALDAAGNWSETEVTTLTVHKATPVVSWATPAPVLYGTPLEQTQLDATADVPGTFTYTPAAGTILPPGQQVLSALFVPSDTADYSSVSAEVTLDVTFSQPCIQSVTSGSLVVGGGQATCIEAGGEIKGSVRIDPGGALWIDGGAVDGSLAGSSGTVLWASEATIRGSVRASSAKGVSLCGSQIGGALLVTNTTGSVLIGGDGCTGNTIAASAQLSANTGGLSFVGNSVSGSASLKNNHGGFTYTDNQVAGATIISGND